MNNQTQKLKQVQWVEINSEGIFIFLKDEHHEDGKNIQDVSSENRELNLKCSFRHNVSPLCNYSCFSIGFSFSPKTNGLNISSTG